jgi:hypothetical protein
VRQAGTGVVVNASCEKIFVGEGRGHTNLDFIHALTRLIFAAFVTFTPESQTHLSD